MAKTISVDPMTRIEGHLKFETSMKNGIVVDARCSGNMFRGIEKALKGYDARVAQQVTQRVCGVCPYAHAEAASLALENAMGIRPNANGQVLRNMVTGAYQLYDYLLHFYVLSALDFIDITAVLSYRGGDETLLQLRDWVKSELSGKKIFPAAPFLPRYAGNYSKNNDMNISAIRHYLDALPMLGELQKMVAIFGGKAPHPISLEAGGITMRPSVSTITHYTTLLNKVEIFIRDKFFNDIVGVATEFKQYFTEGRGYQNLLSYPYFPDQDGDNFAFAGGSIINGKYQPLDINAIKEDQVYSFYKNQPSRDVKPMQGGDLEPISWDEYQQEIKKENGKYSWTRAPRYAGNVMEVGPVARILNTYHAKSNSHVTSLVNKLNKQLGVTLKQYPSVMGRHLCRYIAADSIIELLRENLEKVKPGVLGFVEHAVPKNAKGYGLTEATRGGLAHWIETDAKGFIKKYEMIVPTTWNISPRDATGKPGAVENMLIGTRVKDEKNPIELARIVRSTDPCIACSVH